MAQTPQTNEVKKPNLTGLVNDPGFQALPLPKQRETLQKITKDDSFGKLSDKDTLAFTTKLRSAPKPPTQTVEKAKPEGAVSKFFGAGPAIPAKPLNEVEKKSPFQSGVVSGAMLDPTKISQQSTFTGQAGEVGRQMYEGAKNWLIATGKDPLHVADPVDAMVKGQAEAYRKVRDGVKTGNHDLLMNGLGEAIGNLSTILGGAKTAEGPAGLASSAREVGFAAKDLTAKRSIVSAASHVMLDTMKDEHGKAIENGVKAESARIGGNVQAINIADEARDPNGFKPKADLLAKVDKAIADKKAGVLLQKKMLPKVALVKGLIQGHPDALTFNQLKQVRTVIGGLLKKSSGVEYSILSDLDKSATTDLKTRSSSLSKIPEWDVYNDSTKKLASHTDGIISELLDTKTGLEYAKKIASEQNKGRLDALLRDLHMPSDTFSKDLKSHKAIINFAKMTEGDSLTAKTANRLIALKQHPIAASMGGTAGVLTGRAIGAAIGSPMAGSFIGLTLGAAAAHDLMSKFDAARAIREIGGPSGVMGVRPGKTSPPSQAPPSTQGPGGGGPSSPNRPPGNTPPAAPSTPLVKGTVSSKLRKLLAPGWVKEAESTLKGADKTLEGMRAKEAHNQEIMKGDTPTPPKGVMPDFTNPEEQSKAISKTENRVEVKKVAEGERGKEPSKRPGMTKDTPEARRAKARERIAARREESTRTHIKTSLEDQARQVAGRMDFDGKSNIELEEGLQELYGENGKRFLKQFQSLARQMKWPEEVYRGYLEDTIDKRAKELAQRPAIPGLETEPKVE